MSECEQVKARAHAVCPQRSACACVHEWRAVRACQLCVRGALPVRRWQLGPLHPRQHPCLPRRRPLRRRSCSHKGQQTGRAHSTVSPALRRTAARHVGGADGARATGICGSAKLGKIIFLCTQVVPCSVCTHRARDGECVHACARVCEQAPECNSPREGGVLSPALLQAWHDPAPALGSAE